MSIFRTGIRRCLSSLQSNTLSNIKLSSSNDTSNMNLLITQLNHLIYYNNKVIDKKFEELDTRISNVEQLNKIEDFEDLMALEYCRKT
jgi:hypothetical protein